jgi:hypothetical protein
VDRVGLRPRQGATLERCRNAQSPAGLTLATDKTRQRTTHYIYNYTNPQWREGYRNMRYVQCGAMIIVQCVSDFLAGGKHYNLIITLTLTLTLTGNDLARVGSSLSPVSYP